MILRCFLFLSAGLTVTTCYSIFWSLRLLEKQHVGDVLSQLRKRVERGHLQSLSCAKEHSSLVSQHSFLFTRASFKDKCERVCPLNKEPAAVLKQERGIGFPYGGTVKCPLCQAGLWKGHKDKLVFFSGLEYLILSLNILWNFLFFPLLIMHLSILKF